MRLLAAATLMLMPLMAAASEPQAPRMRAPTADAQSPRAGAAPSVAPDRFDRMNLYRERPGCKSIARQVAGEDGRHGGTRLDRLPPGQVLLAVERQVNGCPEAVLLSEERRRARRPR